MNSWIRLLGACGLIAFISLPGAPAWAGDGLASLRMVPEDATLVITINVARAKQSATARSALKSVLDQGQVKDSLADLRANAGFDIERDLDTVVVAMPQDFARSERYVVVLEGRFDQRRFTALFKEKSTSFVRKKHRGVTYAVMDGDSEMAFLGKSLVLTPKGAMSRIIDVHKDKARSATHSARLMDLIKGGDTSRDAWLAFVLPDDLRTQIATEAGGHSVHALVASVDLQSSLRVAMAVTTSSESAAHAIATLARTSRDQAAQDPALVGLGLDIAVKGMTVKSRGPMVELGIHLTEADLHKLEFLLAAM